jgi:hypothetical protein
MNKNVNSYTIKNNFPDHQWDALHTLGDSYWRSGKFKEKLEII